MAGMIARAALQLILVVAFIGGAAYTVQWLVDTRPSAPQQAVAEPIYAVRAVKAEAGFEQPRISVFGEVSARRSVELRALVAGQVVYVNDALIAGGAVDRDETLLRIDDFSYQGRVVEARANLKEAEARLAEAEAQLAANKRDVARVAEQVTLAERDVTRAQSLVANRTLSERAVDERELTLVQRRQSLEAAQSAETVQAARIAQQSAVIERLKWSLSQAERDLADTELRAPFDAVVRSETVGLGKRLSVNDVVAQLYQAGALDVRFTLSDSQFGRLAADAAPLTGRAVSVVWNVGDTPLQESARLERIGADVASTTGGVSMLARIEEKETPSKLRPGAFVTVSLADRGFENSYRLPEAALYDGDHVFALTPVSEASDERVWRLSRVEAEALAWDGPEVLVRGPLDGLYVLTSRLAEAGDGVKVRLLDGVAERPAPEAAPGVGTGRAQGGRSAAAPGGRG